MTIKLSAQQQIVLDYLRGGSKGPRTLTNVVAITCLGVGSLSSRIAELRKVGFEIEGTDGVDRFERSYKQYDLRAEPPAGTVEEYSRG